MIAENIFNGLVDIGSETLQVEKELKRKALEAKVDLLTERVQSLTKAVEAIAKSKKISKSRMVDLRKW